MKKNKIIMIVLILIIILQFVWIAYLSIINPSWDNVNISVKENTLTSTGVTLTIKNKNLMPSNYSFDEYYIDKKVGDRWVEQRPLSTYHESIRTFVVIGNASHTLEKTLNWNDKYGSLTSGTYRIRFEPKSYNRNFSFGTTLKVEFTLKLSESEILLEDNVAKASFTRTYSVLNVADSNDGNYLYLTIKQFQIDEIETVKVLKSLANSVEVNKNYEFNFKSSNKNFENNIKSIFENAMLESIKETNKTGLEQIQDKIQ